MSEYFCQNLKLFVLASSFNSIEQNVNKKKYPTLYLYFCQPLKLFGLASSFDSIERNVNKKKKHPTFNLFIFFSLIQERKFYIITKSFFANL